MPEVIRKENQKTTQWSGGTTTELFLYPPEGSYASRNFLFRLSSAFCENAESVFTSLPGVRRILMVLDGRITLCHDGKRKVTLEPGDQDSFTGDEMTRSTGGCVDFNLMMKENTEGHLFYRRLQPEKKVWLEDFSIKGKPDLSDGCYFAVYVTRGKTVLTKSHKIDRIILKEKDFCIFREGENLGSWGIKSEENSNLVFVQIICRT